VKHRKLGWIESDCDDLDWQLLEQLQDDARQSFAELGRRVALSAPAVAERIRRLEDRGVLRGYQVRLDPAALGLTMPAVIEVHVKRSDYAKFQNSVTSLNWILECHHVTGRSAFILKAALPDLNALESLIGYLSQFGETTTSLVLSTVVPHRKFKKQP
jgi:Lrp/AsnC family transcriptional regulator, leucine-responsive regulatory protein